MIDIKEEDESEYKVELLNEEISKELKTYKIIIVGRYGVGKTRIIHRLMKDNDDDKEYSPTISVDTKTFKVKVNDQIIQIQIWDTCGNDEFAQSTPNMFKNASISIIVYAINDQKSFDDIEIWYNLIIKHSIESLIFLIGNKSDLKEERKISIEEGEELKESYENNIKVFFETSAKNDDNIDKLLKKISILLAKKNESDEKINNIKLEKEELQKKKKKKKCVVNLNKMTSLNKFLK